MQLKEVFKHTAEIRRSLTVWKRLYIKFIYMKVSLNLNQPMMSMPHHLLLAITSLFT